MHNKIRVTNIEWDTNGESAEELGLPKSVEICTDLDAQETEDMLCIVDMLCDEYGYFPQ